MENYKNWDKVIVCRSVEDDLCPPKKGTIRAILCFIIQRNDVKQFQTSNIDLIYKNAVYQASLNGVEIKTIQVEWTKQGQCYFVRNDLPIYLKMENEKA